MAKTTVKAKENLEVKDLEFDADGIFIQDGSEINKICTYSTGSLGLDILTGGFSPGVMQAWGPDGIGKTTLLLIMAGEFQKANNYENCRVYLWATEGRYNPRLCTMAPALVMDSPTETLPDSKTPRPIFRVSRPKSGEKMYDFILKTLKQDKIKFFHIIDSSDGIKSEVNDEKTMSEAEKTASTATLNTRFLKEASVLANHYGHVIAYTHQIRDKISQGQTRVSGVGKHHGGGHIVDHMANLRLGFEKLWTDLYIFENPNDSQSKKIGHIMSMVIEKTSNSGNVHNKASVPFIYNHGIDKIREIATLSDAYGLISKKGAWYTLDDKNIAQGYNKLLQFLKESPEVLKRLESEIRQTAGI